MDEFQEDIEVGKVTVLAGLVNGRYFPVHENVEPEKLQEIKSDIFENGFAWVNPETGNVVFFNPTHILCVLGTVNTQEIIDDGGAIAQQLLVEEDYEEDNGT